MDQNNENITLDQVLAQTVEALRLNDKSEIMDIVNRHPHYSTELNDFISTWEEVNSLYVPEVRPHMDAVFYKMLNDVPKPNSNKNKLWSSLKRWASDLRLWAVLLSLIVGITIGKLTTRNTPSEVDEKTLTAPNPSVIYASSNIEFSAFDRLEEIRKSRDLKEPNMQVLEALNKALLYDSNVNVRLSALETLIIFSEYPNVREYLIKSIPFQDSPIVLVELAELMSALQEKQSVEGWKEVLDSEQTESDVKNQLTEKLIGIL